MKLLRWIVPVILLWAGMPVVVHAEKQATSPIEMGAKAAYGRVTLFRGGGDESVTNLRYKNGFAFGISAQHGLHAMARVRIGIQPEFLFVRRGVGVEYEGLILGTSKFSYLELPILGRALFPASEYVSPYVVIGPRFGLLLRAERTDINGNEQDISSNTNNFDLGFSAGAGVLFHVGSHISLSLEGRYDQSLTNNIEPSGEDVTNDQRHRAFFLMLGVSMGIGGPAAASADASPAP